MFHKSQLGRFGDVLPSDINGYVPEPGDDPADFAWDHDGFLEDFDQYGNGYEGYAEEQWELFVDQAQEATEAALEAIERWQWKGI